MSARAAAASRAEHGDGSRLPARERMPAWLPRAIALLALPAGARLQGFIGIYVHHHQLAAVPDLPSGMVGRPRLVELLQRPGVPVAGGIPPLGSRRAVSFSPSASGRGG